MNKLQKILLTTDFSEAARNAYAPAAALARQFGARIHLVHSAESLPPHYFLHAQGIYTGVPKEPYLEEIEVRLRDQEATHEAFEGVEVEPKLLYHSSPEEAVCHFMEEEGIDLAVLSTHGRSALGYLFMGSFAQKIVRLSPVPVLTCRPHKNGERSFEKPEKVIVPFDFSESSEAVFPLVRFLGESYGSTFTFLHVQEPVVPVGDYPFWGYYGADTMNLIEEAGDRARERFEQIRKKQFKDLKVIFEIHEGVPYPAIVEEAERSGADLVLMSTHGWTGFKHYLLGSVAEKVLHRAPCSVLTVRPVKVRAPAAEARPVGREVPAGN